MYPVGTLVDIEKDPGCLTWHASSFAPTTTTTFGVPTTTTMKMTVPGLVTTTAKAELTTTTTTTTVAPSDCPFSATENDSPCHHTMCAVDTTSTECIDVVSKYCTRMYGTGTAVDIQIDPGCVAIVEKEIKPTTTTSTTTTPGATTMPLVTTTRLPSVPKTTTVGIVSPRPTTTTKGASECPFDHEDIYSPCQSVKCGTGNKENPDCIDVITHYCKNKYGYGNRVNASVDPGCVFFVDKSTLVVNTAT